ncbi:hypothetical protein C8R47DRAFT_1220139 [Mycena vitilis]|nr:hypothetical protein C8R47DRAFT_1220139 [Mycena vitilis]
MAIHSLAGRSPGAVRRPSSAFYLLVVLRGAERESQELCAQLELRAREELQWQRHARGGAARAGARCMCLDVRANTARCSVFERRSGDRGPDNDAVRCSAEKGYGRLAHHILLLPPSMPPIQSSCSQPAAPSAESGEVLRFDVHGRLTRGSSV